MKLLRAAALSLLVIASACDAQKADPTPAPTQASSPSPAPAEVRKRRPFDRLTMELHLRTDRVRPGGVIHSQVELKNDSRHAVTDPGCLLYAYRFALVPADDPAAELWGQVVVDCSGPFVVRPGHIDSYRGPSFRATDRFGDPLPVGEYLAVMELEKRSERFVEPVTIAE